MNLPMPRNARPIHRVAVVVGLHELAPVGGRASRR